MIHELRLSKYAQAAGRSTGNTTDTQSHWSGKVEGMDHLQHSMMQQRLYTADRHMYGGRCPIILNIPLASSLPHQAATHSQPSTAHSLTALSSAAVSKYWPSGLNAMTRSARECPAPAAELLPSTQASVCSSVLHAPKGEERGYH